MGSYSQAAQFYDLLYAEIKDYEADTGRLLTLFEAAVSPVGRVLDVGCGTGRQAQLLRESGMEVDGLDLEPGFIEIAQDRNPAGAFRVGDMTDFEVSEPYDAVLCLFGSVGYALDELGLRATIGCLARAVRAGGIVVLEPWFEPGAMTDGHVTMHSAEGDGVHVCRMSRTSIRGDISRLEFEYMVGRSGGIERLSEVHELGLFSGPVIEDAFREAGLEVRYDSEGLMGRGIYLASKPGDSGPGQKRSEPPWG